jgi:hypothetical protein
VQKTECASSIQAGDGQQMPGEETRVSHTVDVHAIWRLAHPVDPAATSFSMPSTARDKTLGGEWRHRLGVGPRSLLASPNHPNDRRPWNGPLGESSAGQLEG